MGRRENRFVTPGNNYFGVHYLAPFATGYMVAANDVKVAAFASLADSLRSFVAIAGHYVQGINDPEAFAAALQSSGKFGINPTTGTKVPTYVSGLASAIRGLHAIVARRRI